MASLMVTQDLIQQHPDLNQKGKVKYTIDS